MSVISYYSRKHVYCAICKQLLLGTDNRLIDGCIIPTPWNSLSYPLNTCEYATGVFHGTCFIDHLLKCTQLQKWMLSDAERIQRKCCYWKHGNKKGLDELCIVECPFGCNDTLYKDLRKGECIEVKCWIEQHVPVCPKFIEAFTNLVKLGTQTPIMIHQD